MLKRTQLVVLLMLPTMFALAQAPADPAAPGARPPVNSFLMNLPMILLFFGLFYFVAIAPQRKQAKQQKTFQQSLTKGDEVVTASGIIGTIAGLTDRVVTLEVSPGTELRILRSQVQAKLKELKTLEVKA